MNISPDSARCGAHRPSERGGAALNFLIIVAVLAVVGYVAARVGPVFYNASLYKVHMQDTVDKAAALGQTASWAEQQLRSGGADLDVPKDATYKVEQREGRLVASVKWRRPVELPGYTYNYDFDHTVKSSTFFTPK